AGRRRRLLPRVRPEGRHPRVRPRRLEPGKGAARGAPAGARLLPRPGRARPGVAAHGGRGRGARGSFLLRNAVDQLIREGYLTRVPGSVDPAGYPAYPALDGQKPAEMLFYAPLVEPAP